MYFVAYICTAGLHTRYEQVEKALNLKCKFAGLEVSWNLSFCARSCVEMLKKSFMQRCRFFL